MAKAKFVVDKKKFKKVLKFLNSVRAEVPMVVTKKEEGEGVFWTRVVDPANVCMLGFEMPVGIIEMDEDEIKFVVNIERLKDIVDGKKGEATITVEGGFLKYKDGGMGYECRLLTGEDVDVAADIEEKLGPQLNCKIVMVADDFKRMLSIAGKMSDAIEFSGSHVVAKGEVDELKLNAEEGEGEGRAQYSIEYLKVIEKVLEKLMPVTIRYATDKPCIIETGDEKVKYKMVVAPRISE